jgi:competence protein ComEC
MKQRPVLLLFVPYAFGIYLVEAFALSIPLSVFAIILAFAAMAFAVTFRKDSTLHFYIMVLLMFTVAWMRLQFISDDFRSQSIHQIIGRPIKAHLFGEVMSNPETRTNGNRAVVSTALIILDGQRKPVRGRLLLNWKDENGAFRRGAVVHAFGTLTQPDGERNPGDFNYRKYLRRKGIAGLFYVGEKDSITVLKSGSTNGIASILFDKPRARIEEIIERFVPERENSALLKGLILGLRGEIRPETRAIFSDTGVIHILAVSGLHVGFVTVFLLLIARIFRLSIKFRTLLLITGLVYYAGLTGFKPPVVRAVTMAVIYLFGRAIQQRTDIYNILATAALFILAINPYSLFDVGFQLSFAAVFGIAFFYTRLSQWFVSDRIRQSRGILRAGRWVLELAFVSLGAQLGTLPLTILYFDKIPLLATFANLLVVPLVQCIVILGFILIGISFVWAQLAQWVGALISILQSIMVSAVGWLAEFPFAKLETIQYTPQIVITSFAAFLLIAGLLLRRKLGWAVICVLLATNALFWSNFLKNRDLQVTFLDIGQGDAALVEMPDNFAFLIDAGPWTPTFDAGERTIAPYLRRRGISSLDAIFISHPDGDHMGGVASLVRQLPVTQIFAVNPGGKKLYPDYRPICDSLGIGIRYLTAGDTINRFSPLQISILAPFTFMFAEHDFNVNERSMVMRIEYGQNNLLFSGDIEEQSEDVLDSLHSFLIADILKVPHHGSKTSSTKSFIGKVQPSLAVISVGKWNRFGHPAPEVLARYDSLGVPYVRTDLNGAVIFRSDGETLQRLR